ncbi:MAG: HEPN domain-containing protein [Bdellovibrionales bacterium]
MAKLSKMANEWFKIARQDLSDAQTLWEVRGLESERTVAFLCQQSTEKSIKGFIQYLGKKILKSHDIKKLTEVIIHLYPDLKELMIEAIVLTPYAVEYRYPDAAHVSLEIEDLENALNIANEVFKKLTELIPHDGKIGT